MKLRKFNAKQEEKKIRRKQAYENNVRVRTVVLSMFVLVGSIMLFTYSNFTKTVTVDVMHAKVGKFVVELTYDANGGTVSPSSKDLNKGEVYGTLPTPERNGYTFNGWYTDRTNGTVVGPSTIMGNDDETIYAHWIIQSYDLVVDPNDGEWDTHTTAQTYTLEYQTERTINDPTRVGYTFTGWDFSGWTYDSNTATYTNSTGSTFNTTTKEFKIGYDDVTLEAQWSINQYTLTVDYDNGDEDDEFTLNYGATKTIEDPEKEGHTFTGWDDGNNDLSYLSNETYTQPAHDVELTATWEANEYKWIVYHKKMDVNGTTYTLSDTEEGEDEYGETFSGTLQNYTGFANPALQEKTIRVENNYPPTTNVINYEYERNQYKLTVNPNGGEYNNSSSNTEYNMYYQETKTISDPIKTCYTFNNWTKTGNSTIQNRILTMGTEATTLEANWNIIQYTITFDPNGGTINNVNDATQVVNCGSSISLLTTSQITREGYTFDGWYTESSGGTQVSAGTIPTSSTTIYAHWTINTFTITFDSNGGTSCSNITKNYGEAWGTLCTTTNGTKIFGGWYENDTLINDTDIANHNINAKAQWIESLEPANFAYTGAVQTYTVPLTGKYKLEVWGAQGGGNSSEISVNNYKNNAVGGNGGYSSGIINLSSNTNLYVYVGGKGNTYSSTTYSNTYPGGFNGGGDLVVRNNASGTSGTGGGATDIRIGQGSLYARVIVAGGGGSGNSAGASSNDHRASNGGAGGGLNGLSGNTYSVGEESLNYERTHGTGGTQTSGGSNGTYGTAATGTFGKGATVTTNQSNTWPSSTGGGGWYGGGGGYHSAAGAGGSGYVYTSSTASNYPSGCLLNSSYYLNDAETIDGEHSFPSPSGPDETGHTGNGYARITYVGN